MPFENHERKRFKNTIPANSADRSIIAAVAGKRIIVTSLIISCGGTATTLQFQSKAGSDAGVDIGPLFSLPANGCVPIPVMVDGLFETVAGAALVADTSNHAAVSVSGTYIEA